VGDLRCPHARGDGPKTGTPTRPESLLSPRPWGWTESRLKTEEGISVVPTPVGMDRWHLAARRDPSRCPHARGDGPIGSATRHSTGKLSPRPWGWTWCRLEPVEYERVVPTPVGMDRRPAEYNSSRSRCPHARGDGPYMETTSRYKDAVVPTPVGMDRCLSVPRRGHQRCPHARGDGPPAPLRSRENIELSPRPWGWTDLVVPGAEPRVVVPTPVGMDRTATNDRPDLVALSPRPWGWTAHPAGVGRLDRVVPTPVGMDRWVLGFLGRGASCPHARGDGPVAEAPLGDRLPLSPRPWGWTDRD